MDALNGPTLSELLDGRPTRSGFVALAGRPNGGKSTLVNAIVAHKVAIVSEKPQTTRRAIRGVATNLADDKPWQLVMTDLPGVQRPRDSLTERMQNRVEAELAEADAVLFVVNGEQGVGGAGDRFIAEALRSSSRPITIAVNKVDRLSNQRTVGALQAAADLGLDAEIFPISARAGSGVRTLVEHLVAQLPEGPFHFAPGEHSDQSPGVLLGELVREQVLKRTRQEVPHAVEVQVTDIEDRGHVVAVTAAVLVEENSQKAILIGAGGSMIKRIGIAARKEIEREVGGQVHLDLSVRVRRSWRADDGMLDRLGFG